MGKRTTQFRNRPERDYTMIRNAAARDPRISLKARGLLLLMLSYDESWTYHLSHLETLMTDGRDSLRSGVRELEAAGYLMREQTRDEKGRVTGVLYWVRDSPSTDGKPVDGKPADGKPATKKNNSKKNNSKKIKHVNSPKLEPVREPELATTSPSVPAAVFGEVWNEYSGNLPKVRLPLTPRRVAAVTRLQQEHGGEALEVFRAAVQAVARNDFWLKRRYGFDNLVPNKVERYAEQWAHSGNLTGADVKLLTRAQRIAAALGDDE